MKKFTARYIILGCIVALLFSLLIGQLVNLQIIHGDENATKAYNKKTKTITTRADRGTITDANSMTLAYDKKIYNIQFYRDPTWVPERNEDGTRPSAYGEYTNSLIETIQIVEKYGGKIESSFSLEYDEATQQWAFNWGNVSDSVKQAREEMWRSNFYYSDTEQYPIDTLFDELCKRYRIPDTLTLEEKIQVLVIWE